MALGQASTTQLRFKKETTFGTAAAGTYQLLRYNSCDFRHTNETVVSDQINSTREPGDAIRINARAEGSIETEFSHDTYDTLMAGAFHQDFSAELGITASTVTLTGSGVSRTWTNTAGTDFGAIGFGIMAGDVIRCRGFTNAANNGLWYVSTKTSATVMLCTQIQTGDQATVQDAVPAPASTSPVNEGPTSIKISGKRLVLGPTLQSFSFEKALDLDADLYEQFLGCCVSRWNMNVAIPGKIELGFDVIGKQGSLVRTPAIGASPTAVTTTGILETVDHVQFVRDWTTSASGNYIRPLAFTLSVDNALAPQPQLGYLGPINMRLDRANITGTLRMYVEDDGSQPGGVFDLYASAVASTNRNRIIACLTDGIASTPTKYVIVIQKYRITNARIPVQGNANDLIFELDFAAQVDPLAINGPVSANGTSVAIHKLIYP